MLTDDVRTAMYAAMKGRRTEEAAALRLLLAALGSAAIEARHELSDEEAVAVLRREAKRRREAEQAYRDAGRADRADAEAFEYAVASKFLPPVPDEADLAALVAAAIAETGASGPKDVGRVMGRVMPELKGRAAGQTVRRLVLARLDPG